MAAENKSKTPSSRSRLLVRWLGGWLVGWLVGWLGRLGRLLALKVHSPRSITFGSLSLRETSREPQHKLCHGSIQDKHDKKETKNRPIRRHAEGGSEGLESTMAFEKVEVGDSSEMEMMVVLVACASAATATAAEVGDCGEGQKEKEKERENERERETAPPWKGSVGPEPN
uniref:Uncharacterized protein n=1 Tax=Vespula pensylvanica TaxID=30213 RepID=A0A834JVA8_VESPE|nr:hypothetical protein H0235_017220 [Vespula pensylvanica]